jgi:23S rRNA pseudouridine2605 synthase
MKERIQKLLANAGVDSRRNVEQMVLDGRVAVNGKTVRELPILVDPDKDRVEVDGERIRLRERVAAKRFYIVMNKPKGVYTTNVAQGEQVRAIDVLGPGFPGRVYPVGRLDADSKGLLLLTNDGDLTNRLTHPRYGVAKTYRAVVEGYVDPEGLEQLEKGIWLADKEGRGFKTGRSRIRVVKRMREKSVLEITIREGRNRQVRRMLASVGHKVKELTRIKMGPLTLEGLAPGQFRPLTPREVKELQRLARGDREKAKEKEK